MKNKIQLSLSILTIAALFLLPLVAYAGPMSPFVGHWQATDIDGSDIRLTIAGPPDGPFQITWKDSHMSFCNGEPGIIRGTGLLNESDVNLLEADLHVECFTTGASMDAHLTLRYHPTTNTLSARYSNGKVIIWHRPGQLPPPPPTLDLRVNYGHDWVESFYEAGHTVWVTVTESDGVTVKATAELFTVPKDSWEGETGFQTQPEDWGPAPPDIQPYDWVYGWVDNGASAQVQIGEINGTINLETNSITGTVLADWFAEELYIICDPWGLSDPNQYRESNVDPDGVDEFECSWSGVLDILPGQELGVWYYGPDGHAVANAFSTPDGRIIAFPEADNVFGYGWPEGSEVYMQITGSEPFPMLATVGPSPWDENDILAYFDFNGLYDLVPGDVVTLSGSGIVETHTVRNLGVTGIDAGANSVSGVANDREIPFVYLFEYPDQIINPAVESGQWIADFDSVGLDLLGGMCGRVDIWDGLGNSTTVDWCVPNTRFTVFPEWNYLEGYEWPDSAVVSISVAGKEACSTEAVSGFPEWDPWNTFFSANFPEGCEIGAGDLITLSSESLILTHQVPALAITEVNLDNSTVAGTAVFDPEGYILHTWIHGVDESYMQLSAEGGAWLADFGLQGFILQPGMGGRVELVDQASNATAAEWRIPNPHFTVFPEWEYLEGYDWPDGATVTAAIEVKPGCSAQAMAGYPEWDPWNTFVSLNFPEGCDVAADDVVTLDDGTTTRTHTVQNLAITATDAEEDTVTGTADPDAQVYAWPHATGEQVLATVDSEGAWQVDFTELFDLVPGEGGRAEIRDESGNATAVDWGIPNPRFAVFPEWEYVEGWAWPHGAPVTAAIEGKPECSAEAIAGYPEWDPWTTFVSMSFPEGCNVMAGDVVTLTDGATTRAHTVQNLAISAIDVAADTVSGMADAGVVLHVWPHDSGQNELQPTAGEDGTWLAGFGAVGFDLLEGMCGRAEIRDEAGSATAADWCVPPPPRILVQISDDWFEGQNFRPNSEQTYEIYESDGGALLLSGTMQAGSQGTAFAWVGDQVDLVPGNYLVISDGITTKELVLEDLTFDLFDLSQGLLQGTAPPPEGRLVWVGIGFPNDGWSMAVFTDPQGNWVANFGAPVAPDYEWVAAQVFDEDGDASEVRPSQIIGGQP